MADQPWLILAHPPHQGWSALAIQNNSQILLAGTGKDGIFTGNQFALVRFNSTGIIDSTFGINGKVLTQIGIDAVIHSISIDSGNSIIATGRSKTSINAFYDFTITKYKSDGALDSNFNTNGILTTDFNSLDDIIYSSAIQSDNRLL